VCNVDLILGENCKPSSFRKGTYCCRKCRAIRSKELRAKKMIELGAAEVRRRDRDRQDKWRKSNPNKDLAIQIRKYDLSTDDLQSLEINQNGVCKLCATPPGVNPRQKRLCKDHDHATGKIRGLLCDKCNRALGMLGDNVDSIAKVLIYLTGEIDTNKRDKAIEIINKI
jgi:hypothetical protein